MATRKPGNEDEIWTILRMILWSADYLEGKGVESGRLDAEHLLAHALGTERLQLYLQFERPLTPDELDAYRPLLKRRTAREPLQYIVGHQPFRELELEVDTSVLIPRPETEILVGHVLEWAESRGLEDATALDVGTGSGAIALSLALEGPFARVVATDVDDDALALVRRNRAIAGLDDAVELRTGSLFEPLDETERFDLVVSNPPYVALDEKEGLQPEVRDWEPARALYGGPDGLDVVRALVAGAATRLVDGGLLALEVGGEQTHEVARMLESSGVYGAVEVLRDYSGRERFVFAHAE